MSRPKAFISYSHTGTNREWVRRFARALEQCDVDVWLDEFKIHAGDNLRGAIEAALRRSDVLIAVITPDSLERPNLFFELGAAVGMGKYVIAIVSKKVDLSALPQSIRLRRFLLQESPERAAKSVRAALRDPDIGSHARVLNK